MAVELVMNWLWQGSLVALAAAAILRVIPTSRTQARYGFLWAACLLVATLPLAPLVGPDAVAAGPPGPVPLAPLVSVPVAWWTSSAVVLGIWLLWCGFHAARLTAAVVALVGARKHCTPCSPVVQRRLRHWSRLKHSGRRTRIVISSRVRSAAVLGGGSPLIALTPALIERLDAADLDRVVIHEWAHVQRHDDRTQIVQLVVRAIAGWHPAVWWLERQLALEREIACDEIAITITGSARAYATCLATLAALPKRPMSLTASPAAVSATSLRKRLVRLLSRHVAAQRPWRAMTICASGALAPVALLAAKVSIVETTAPSLNLLPARPGLVETVEEPGLTGVAAGLPPASSDAVPAMGLRRTPSRENAVRTVHADVLPVVAASVAPAPPAFDVPLPANDPNESPDDEATVRRPESSAVQVQSPAVAGEERAPWISAAVASVAIARSSRQAGVGTASFFNRFGKRIASSF